MLNEDQMKEFFQNLRQKHPQSNEGRPSVEFTLIEGKSISSGADLNPELLRDFSDLFMIAIDALRKCSFEEIELLMLEAFTNADEKSIPSLLHIPFEIKQSFRF